MGRQIHAQTRNTNRPELKRKEFQSKKLVTQVLRIKGSGKEFSALVPGNASVDEAIEAIARQNNGNVKKKYYKEMNAYEIIEISIGDQLITKDKTGGIHWFIDDNKIPIAVDDKGNIEGFLNGKEAKVGRNVISIGLESSTADPKRIDELKGIRRSVEGAHTGERDKEPDLKHNEIILFDKETGELSPMCPCQEAESFDYREISMERIFVSEISAVENKQNPVLEKCFDERLEKGMGEVFYSYIEIIDAKDSIIDRITVVSEPVEIPVVGTIGAAEDLVSPDEGFSSPVTETDYTAQPIMIEPIPAAPKLRVLPPVPEYFQNKKQVKNSEEIKLQKLKAVKQKLFRYPPKIEKIETAKIKRTESYAVPAPVAEIPGKKTKIRKMDNKPKARAKKMPKKKVPKKRKRKRKKAIGLAKKTSVKIKKIKAKIRELVKYRKKKQFTKPEINTLKKKVKPRPEIKSVKSRKKKPKVKSQVKTKVKKQKKEKPKKSLRLEKPGKKVKKKRNKRNNHKRLHQMLV